VGVLTPLVVTNLATDGNPNDRLTLSLGPGAPANAVINPRTGVFRWTPTRDQAPSTNLITVNVTDNGVPPLSATTSFTVMVNDYVEITAGSTVLNAGESNSVPIDLFSSTELLNLQCVLHFAGERLTNLAIEELTPEVAGISLQPADASSASLAITAAPGHTLLGAQHLARLHFTTLAGQSSAITSLSLSSVSGTKATDGLTPTHLANNGRIIIVGDQPLLEA